MGEWRFERYEAGMRAEWDAFVKESRNATFLFERGYMDYHSDRFADCSLLARQGGRLLAMLPANIDSEGVLHSHQGLTYGGWMLPERHLDGSGVLEMWEAWLEWCRAEGVREIDYKPLPWIYCRMPSEEDRYALFRSGARLAECNLSSAIRLAHNPGFNQQQRRNLRKGEAVGAVIRETSDASAFMKMLEDCLRERHDASPVHSLAELQLLRDEFPNNIRIFVAEDSEGVEAGVCMYECGPAAHAQYIASTGRGRSLGLLTLLFERLIGSYTAGGAVWFDFGISNEDHGLKLNSGLLRQKFSLGGTGVAYERYTLPLD